MKSTRKGRDLYVYRSQELAAHGQETLQGSNAAAKTAKAGDFVQVRVHKSLLTQLNVEQSTNLSVRSRTERWSFAPRGASA